MPGRRRRAKPRSARGCAGGPRSRQRPRGWRWRGRRRAPTSRAHRGRRVVVPPAPSSRQERWRESEHEGEPCCLLALEAEEECCRQRRARARYAGDQRADLRDPDDQAVEKPHSLDRSLMPSDQLGKAEQQRHDDESETDDFEAADRGGAGVEQLGEGKPGNADRYRADRDPEGEPERAVGEVAPADGRQRAEQEVADITPKIADDRGERGQLAGWGIYRVFCSQAPPSGLM